MTTHNRVTTNQPGVAKTPQSLMTHERSRINLSQLLGIQNWHLWVVWRPDALIGSKFNSNDWIDKSLGTPSDYPQTHFNRFSP